MSETAIKPRCIQCGHPVISGCWCLGASEDAPPIGPYCPRCFADLGLAPTDAPPSRVDVALAALRRAAKAASDSATPKGILVVHGNGEVGFIDLSGPSLEERVATLESEIAELRARLDETPVEEADPAACPVCDDCPRRGECTPSEDGPDCERWCVWQATDEAP